MCGRYVSALPPAELARIFRVFDELPNFAPDWNVAPTALRPVVRRHPATGARRLDLLNWGLVPNFTRDLTSARKPINARAETVRLSGLFRDAFARRRCLVPADLFYEWKAVAGGKQPFAIGRIDARPMALAGLWEGWKAPDGTVLRTYAIVTTAANADLAPLHHRMPLILEEPDWPAWLGEVAADAGALLAPPRAGGLRRWPVSRAVGNVRNNGPQLVEPIAEADGVDADGGPNSA